MAGGSARLRSALLLIVALLPCITPAPVAAQGTEHAAVLEHRGVGLELGFLNAGLSYAYATSARTAYGVSGAFGAQVGVMLAADAFSSGAYSTDRLFAEIAHGAIFVRHQLSPRVHMEFGPRAAWLYHAPTEHETMFYGAHAAAYFRIARLRRGTLSLGPRIQFGRLDGSGSTSWNAGVIPLAGRIALWW